MFVDIITLGIRCQLGKKSLGQHSTWAMTPLAQSGCLVKKGLGLKWQHPVSKEPVAKLKHMSHDIVT